MHGYESWEIWITEISWADYFKRVSYSCHRHLNAVLMAMLNSTSETDISHTKSMFIKDTFVAMVAFTVFNAESCYFDLNQTGALCNLCFELCIDVLQI